jgi:Type II restriction endonuclease EcoO109I
MARGHVDLPASAPPLLLSKSEIYEALERIDADEAARARVLQMETRFRTKIDTHLASLPAASAPFQKFSTSPFVLLFHSKRQGYERVAQVERDIIPAKVFSSMETSAGRMVEEVVLPVYGWEVVPSQMHSAESLLDGRKTEEDDFFGATLKSGPRCLNDEMAQQIGRDVVANIGTWAQNHGTTKVDFTYGVLYGTKRQSNKKDWHILRSIAEVLPTNTVISTSHRQNWSIGYQLGGLEVTATVRIGIEWWAYLGGENAWLEMCLALIRACITAAGPRIDTPQYLISDLGSILDTSGLPTGFNVAIIQQSQIEWLLFLARHFSDGLVA